MNRMLLGAAMAAAAAFGLAQTADAQVEISGRVYHVAVCAKGSNGPGEARCHAHVVTDKYGNPRFQNPGPNFVPSGFGPSDLRSAYSLAMTGSTATVAIVDAYGYNSAESDMNNYRQTYGIPLCQSSTGCFRKVNQYGGTSYPSQNTGWAQETALDLDMVSAVCPTCHILLVEASSNSYSNLATAENYAASQGVHAISNSYGGGESGTQSVESAYNHPGIAITVSSGDSGYGVQFPASSPHVTAVGGTSLYHAGSGWAESAWSGAGSGCSTVYSQQSWQNFASNNLCSMRMVADVSAVADPNTGVAVFGPVNRRGSGWLVFGGTSVAAPLTAGVYGLNGGAVNYGSNPYAPAASLNDVTSGSNGSCGGTYLCTAGPGYDGPTGLGTPKGSSAY